MRTNKSSTPSTLIPYLSEPKSPPCGGLLALLQPRSYLLLVVLRLAGVRFLAVVFFLAVSFLAGFLLVAVLRMATFLLAVVFLTAAFFRFRFFKPRVRAFAFTEETDRRRVLAICVVVCVL